MKIDNLTIVKSIYHYDFIVNTDDGEFRASYVIPEDGMEKDEAVKMMEMFVIAIRRMRP